MRRFEKFLLKWVKTLSNGSELQVGCGFGPERVEEAHLKIIPYSHTAASSGQNRWEEPKQTVHVDLHFHFPLPISIVTIREIASL